MHSFQHIITRSSGMAELSLGVSALVLPSASGGLFSANGKQGGMVAFDPDHALAPINSYGFGKADKTMRAGSGQLEQLHLGGKDMLVSFGQAGDAKAFDLAAGTVLWKPASLDFGGQTLLAVKAMTLADGSDLIFTSSLQSLGISCWLRNAAGQINLHQQLVPNNTTLGYEVLAMALVAQDNGAVLLAVSAQGDALNAFRIDATGQAQFVASLGAGEGLGIGAPNLVQSLRLAGRDYALLGAAGSGSIAVIEVGAAGQLQLVDQVNDDLNTRFQGISVLQTTSAEGRVFVLAGGGDDGLSLMTLLPNGRLLHLATVADGLDTALENISAVAMRASGSGVGLGLDIFATGWSETAISQFRVDLGALAPIQIAAAAGGVLSGDARGDLLLGGLGRDQLYGGAGDDILIDGAGSDTLDGGAGADVFVFSADGQTDTVLDFDPAADRLDLSGLGRIYAREAISFSALAGGILLTVLGEQIKLYTANGKPIPADTLTDALLFNMSHVPVYQPITTGQDIEGTTLADTLLGSPYNDTITGHAGNDLIDGGAGYDRVIYDGPGAVVVDLALLVTQNTGQGWDILRSIEHITSGSGDDSLSGNAAHNGLIGGAGNDSLSGRDGNDTLYGETGNDQLYGGLGVDTAWFCGDAAVVVNLAIRSTQNTGQGKDTLRDIENLVGGNRNDSLTGDAGANSLWGRADGDVLKGGAGNDSLYGDADSDTLYGGAGNDRLDGGSGNDTASFRGAVAVAVNLAIKGAQNTGLGWDTLLNIENLAGSTDNDALSGNDGSNSIWAREGADTVNGGAGRDLLYGEAGNDRLSGGADSDRLYAGADSDTLYGGAGHDTLYGGSGNDLIDGGPGNDVFYGGSGRDTFVFHATNHGDSRVLDLAAGDYVQLLGYGYGSARVALSHFSQTTAGVVFNNHGDTVLFAGAELADFSGKMLLL